MSGGGNPGAGGGGSGGSKKLSYNGGKVPGTFDKKTFDTTLYSDASKAYQAGPKVNPISGYTPLTSQTSGLIDQALATNTARQSGPLAQFASGANLGNGNPYLDAVLAKTRDDVGTDVNAAFASNGTYGSDIHAGALTQGLADAENSARFGQYNTDVGNMFQAQGALDSSTANALGYSGLLDQKAQQKTLADQQQWDAKNNKNYNQIAKYLSLVNGGGDTNQPLSLWDVIGGLGSVAGSIL